MLLQKPDWPIISSFNDTFDKIKYSQYLSGAPTNRCILTFAHFREKSQQTEPLVLHSFDTNYDRTLVSM